MVQRQAGSVGDVDSADGPGPTGERDGSAPMVGCHGERAEAFAVRGGERGRSGPWGLGSAGVVMIGVSYGFARYGYGLFEPRIRDEFGLSVAGSGAIASGAYVGYVLALCAAGLLASRVGPRPLITAAGVSAAGGLAIVVVADRPWQLLVGLVLAGASSGFAWAPYSDAVAQLVAPSHRTILLAAISSGTAFGIAVAGGLALTGGTDGTWRWAWTVFIAVAVLATVYNLWLLRGTRPVTDTPSPAEQNSLRFFLRPGTRGLYATALSYGIVGAGYWTFAVAAVSQATPATATAGPVFWALIGLAGTVAIWSGRAFSRWGLRRSHLLLFAGLATATVLVAALPGWWPAISVSAIIYGIAFMATSGLLAVWSYRVFPDRPAVGFSATVFFLGLGSIAGPALTGTLADRWNLPAALLCLAAIAVATTAARPPAPERHNRAEHERAGRGPA